MAGSRITKPNAQTFALVDLVEEVLAGGVRIPEFQRSFRWQWEDVRRLVDSIIRGYPIGSILLWERPAQQDLIRLGALQIDAPRKDEALWVVDGQQRLTSLANALSQSGDEDPRFAIAYDLSKQDFVKRSGEQVHVIDLPTIFDLQKLLKWFSEHPESAQYLEEATRITKIIREYSIPAYIVKQEDEDILRDIFDRMNNYGKRLTRAEVFSALHGRTRESGESQNLADIISKISGTYLFGEIDDDTVLSAILARRGPDVTRDIRKEFSDNRVSKEFPEEDPEEAYRNGEQALVKAVSFLQKEAGVPHFSFLTYRYLLVVLTRFFAHHSDPNPRNSELLRRWFWRAAIIGPEAFSTWTKASRVLCSKIIPNSEVESVQALLDAVAGFTPKSLNFDIFRSTTASSRILLCALWAKHPRSFLNGQPYSLENLGQALESKRTARDIVVTILSKDPKEEKTPTANRFIFLGEESIEYAREILRQRPSTMNILDWTQLMDSHAVSSDARAALASEDIESFLKLRTIDLNQLVKEFIDSMAGTSFEDTPPLSSLIIDEEEEIDDEDQGDEYD